MHNHLFCVLKAQSFLLFPLGTYSGNTEWLAVLEKRKEKQ